MANIKIYHAGTGTLITPTIDENRYAIEQTYVSTQGSYTFSISGTADPSYKQMRYLPAENQERTVVIVSNSNYDFNQAFISDSNSFTTGFGSVAYTHEQVGSDYHYTITVPANKRLLLCAIVSTRSSGSVYYTYYGGGDVKSVYNGGTPSSWEDAKTNIMIPNWEWGNELYPSWKFKKMFRAYYIDDYSGTAVGIGNWAVTPGEIVKIKDTTNSIGVFGVDYTRGFCIAGSATGNSGSLIQSPSSTATIVTAGTEYIFEVPEGCNYIVSWLSFLFPKLQPF